MQDELNMQAEICIVGGGFCGVIVAHALKQIGFDCILLEKKPELYEAKDSRSFVLSYGSGLLLSNMNLWPKNLATYKLQEVKFSLQGFFGRALIKADDYNVPWLGSVINASTWQKNCLENAMLPKTLTSVNIKKITQKSSCSEVLFQHKDKMHKLETKFIIAADGTNSWAANEIGFTTTTILEDYAALITSVSNMTSQHAWLKGAKSGCLAYIPHSSSGGALIWTAPKKTIEKLKNPKTLEILTKRTAKQALSNAIIDTQKINVLPVKATKTTAAANPLGICIGSALQTLPPVAAQGFNLGIRDCATIVEILAAYSLQKTPIDYALVAKEFLQQRLADGEKTLNTSLLALKAYEKASFWRGLSSLGLLAANANLSNNFKQQIIRSLGLQKPYNKLLLTNIAKLKQAKNAR